MRNPTAWFWSLLLVLSATCFGNAAPEQREETIDGHRVLVLENQHIRMKVLPDPGGTVIEFLQKQTGVNHVYGGDFVLKGRLGFGWKDYYWLEAFDKLGKGVYSLPYAAEFRSGPGYHAIYVTCTTEGQKFEREMRLADDSAELTTISRITNVGTESRRLQIRWHTYSTLDDQFAENSCIIAPGQHGEVRKCFIGSGYDHQFITTDGYWMALNYANGSGMWITFKKEQNPNQITWTDYNYTRKSPARGAYVAEPLPQAVLAQPGASALYESTFFPFTAADAPATIPLGVLQDAQEQARARSFLQMVCENAAALGPYTMTPGAPAGGNLAGPDDANRFNFSHRRRDRFALRPWGMLDAMFDLPGVQQQTVRTRYYAQLFARAQQPQPVTFRLRVYDSAQRLIKEHVKQFTLNSTDARVVDVRDDIDIAALPDGTYRFDLEGLVPGETEPIHVYSDTQRLVGQARETYEQKTAQREAGPLTERPFVTALREVALPKHQPGQVTVPIGVEDASGIQRTNWPVRLGVPFAQGMVTTQMPVELLTPTGKHVPLQTQVMATWMDGSVKWLLLDFNADVPADSHVFYTLNAGAAQPAPVAAPLVVLKDQQPVFSAGPLAQLPVGDKLLGLFGPRDLWWSDSTGQQHFFRLTGENAGVEIEENGPNRAVIKATGWYYNEHDRPVCMGELRLEYSRGQSFARLYHTVTYCGDPWRESLGSYGVQLQLPGAGFTAAATVLDGQVQTGKQITLYQPTPDGARLRCDGQETLGQRGNGAVSLTAPGRAPVAVYHREFWQMAPKQIDVDAAAGAVKFSYWPSAAGAMSFLPREDGWIPSSSSAEAVAVGMGRTQELILDFASEHALPQFDQLYHEPVVAIVPPRYLRSTQVMLHLADYDPQQAPAVEKIISDTMDFYIDQQDFWGWYGQWHYGGIPNFWRQPEYKWWNFGRYAWILNEQDIVEAPWLCYLRSGDRKYLKFARANTRHLMEVATIRWNPVWPKWVGFSRRHHECIWLGSGDHGHSMLDPFLDYYYATGYRPARDAAVRLADGMALTTSGTWRYIANPIAGLSRMYLDTQNPRYKEHADRIWNTLCYPEQNNWWLIDHGDRMVMWYAQINPQCRDLWLQWMADPKKRERFDGIDVLMDAYHQTGDASYAAAAASKLPKQRPQEITQHVLSKLRAWCYYEPVTPPAAPQP